MILQSEAVQRQESMAQTRDTIRHYMNLANESVALLKFTCSHTPDAFMHELILPRVAVLVSVYLDRLAHGGELRVKGNLRVDYNFNAALLHTSVVAVFNKLCEQEERKESFLDAIVEDEAHFRRSSYEKGIRILRRRALMAASEVDAFERALVVLVRKLEEKKNVEMMLGEIPNEYLDPIMQTLMTDPVILGVNSNEKDRNRYVMDRKVIERHLMNNPNNPFNREPLSKGDLIPDVELKREIEEWVASTLRKYKEKEEEEDGDTGGGGGDDDEQKQQ